jgi:hypothetical protein
MIEAAAHAVGEAVAELAVVVVQSIAAVRIAVIGKIILARQGTAVSRCNGDLVTLMFFNPNNS